MDDKPSRVRWDEQELTRLAADMAVRMRADPHLPLLEAVRAAQACLEPHRRRELKTWTVVEARLQPKLVEALARLQAAPAAAPVPAAGEAVVPPVGPVEPQAVPDAPPVPIAGVPALDSAEPDEVTLPVPAEAVTPQAVGEVLPAENGEAAAAPSIGDLFADQPLPPALQPEPSVQAPARAGPAAEEQRPAVRAEAPAAPAAPVEPVAAPAAALSAANLEAALIAALQSPAVEAVLVDLFTRALSQAVARVGAEAAQALPASAPGTRHAAAAGPRVLLAGFPEGQQRALMEALSGHFEVRSWKPSNGPQLFETLARACRVVVFPEDTDDEVDAGLKDLDVRVIRHEGNAARLVERIEELA